MYARSYAGNTEQIIVTGSTDNLLLYSEALPACILGNTDQAYPVFLCPRNTRCVWQSIIISIKLPRRSKHTFLWEVADSYLTFMASLTCLLRVISLQLKKSSVSDQTCKSTQTLNAPVVFHHTGKIGKPSLSCCPYTHIDIL